MHRSFEGHLTARDCKRHIPHYFEVPAGSTTLDIQFHFTPYRVHQVGNMLTLTLFDPAGFRGAGHRGGAVHPVHIDPAAATPGYRPGPLPAGEWMVEIDTHMIMPGDPVHYQLEIVVTQEEYPDAARTPVRPAPRPQRGPGWYRGDLHTHTQHSDGTRCTVADLVQGARAAGLDFVQLTDHNTNTGLDELDALGDKDLLTIGGIELTTFWGHALCMGTRDWVDWRVRPDGDEMARIAAQVEARGELFVIAHPQAVGDPYCTGCVWRYGQMMPGSARLVEIWNEHWGSSSNNEAALALWYDWLNQGLRMIATAGTDAHHTDDYAKQPGFNVVYAAELTEPALWSAVRAGHLYLSAGPELTLEAADKNGGRWMMGDTVTQPVTCTLTFSNCPTGAVVRTLANGRLLSMCSVDARSTLEWQMQPAEAEWMVVEIRDQDGGLLAITNPLFFVAPDTTGE